MLEELEDAIERQVGRRPRPPIGSDNEGPSVDVQGRPPKDGPRNGGSGERPESTEQEKEGRRPPPPAEE